MPRKICSLVGLVFMGSLLPGIGFSQLKIETTGGRVQDSPNRTFVPKANAGELTAVGAKVWTSPVIDLKNPLPVFDIVGLNVDQKSNGYLIQIHCTKQLTEFESWLKPIGNDTWLYITLADAKADIAVLKDFKPTSFVKKIRIFESETSVQITFLLKGQVNSAELIPAEGSQDILVAVPTQTEEDLAIRKAP